MGWAERQRRSMIEKTYRIEFNGDKDDDKKRYSSLYAWFVAGGNRQDHKGMEVGRREAKLVDKFQALGVRPVDVPENAEGVRLLLPGLRAMTVDQPELELIRRYVLAIAPRTEHAGRWVEMVDWLNDLKPEATEAK